MAISGPSGRSGSIQLNTGSTTQRQSPRTDFGTQFRNGAATGAGIVGGAVGVAAPFVPGGAVVSAAINAGAGAMMSGQGYGGGGGGDFVNAGNLPGNLSGPSLLNGTDQFGKPVQGQAPKQGSSKEALLEKTKDMQEMMQSFNLEYLQIQEKMQAENRSFSTVSNVMKTKHDTAKSSIQNVR